MLRKPVRIRAATTGVGDVDFLRAVLAWAACWREPAESNVSTGVQSGLRLGVYLEGWGRPGDAGVVAEERGRLLGAAWYRSFTELEHGYGFLSPDVPELTAAVRPGERGGGIGTALLRTLVERAAAESVLALSLSVEEDNPALRLYERLGFTRVARAGDAWTMRRELG